MGSLDIRVPVTNNYKYGSLSVGGGSALARVVLLPHATPPRTFVTGEKFWITASGVVKDGVILMFYSDPYDDIRYYGQVKFFFPKGTVPSPDEVMKTISEVVTVDGAPAPASSSVAHERTMAPVPPPPPPPDAAPPQPKTVSLGLTKAQVVAILGQPIKVANLGAKEIVYYPDMKVILVKGKVTDVQ
jgi:hypothetical protein